MIILSGSHRFSLNHDICLSSQIYSVTFNFSEHYIWGLKDILKEK